MKLMSSGGLVRALGLLSAAVAIGCASGVGVAGAAGESDRRVQDREVRGGTIREALQNAGPDSVEALSHVATLANDFFEGRGPGTRGGRVASEYIEHWFARLGLRPAFEGEEGKERLARGSGSSFQQGFTVRGGLELIEAGLSFSGTGGVKESFRLGSDFHPLGFSGNGMVRGPVVFAGYSIEDGPRGYRSYEAGDDLTGKVAIVLRFEPLDENGSSRWGRNGSWSRHAGLPGKMRAAQERGAAAVILVTPPGADDPRAEYLETHQSTSYNAGIEIPVVQMAPAAANRLIGALCGECDRIERLRERADLGETGVVSFGSGEISIEVELERERVPTTNVAGILPGRGRLAGEYVVVGGHYDHLGYGHFGARDPQNAGQVHAGADDNASGIASMLVAARRVKEAYDALPEGAEARSIIFVGFAGEEMGLLGSEHFASAAASLESGDIVAMLNLDMVGRIEDGRLEANGVGTSAEWDEMVSRIGAAHGLRIEKNKAGIGPSDHTVFYQAGVPVLHFFSGTHADYHTVRDRFETLNYVGCAQVAALVADLTVELGIRGERLEFVSTGDAGMRGGRGRAKVRLGIMPASYGESEEPGVPVGEVFEGTSAAEAGMLKGDRIVRWGGEEVAGVGGMMEHLASHEPGDEVEIVVLRGGLEVALRVVLKARVAGR